MSHIDQANEQKAARDPSKVAVYNCTRHDVPSRQNILVVGKASLQTIKEMRASPVIGSSELVNVSSLDGNGLYFPT